MHCSQGGRSARGVRALKLFALAGAAMVGACSAGPSTADSGGLDELQMSGETSLWPDSEVPAAFATADHGAIELGVKLKSTVAGEVTGIRFYKASGNTGTHVGHLWTASGAPLASVTFTQESATGWQTARFSQPVAIEPNTVYVASYFAPVGQYAGVNAYFTGAGHGSPPLYALQDGEQGGNGVYA